MEIKEAGKRLTGMLAGTKGTNLAVVLAAAAMALILLSDMSCVQKNTPEFSTPDSTAAYARQLESQLTDIITSVEGAGETRVMVTLQNGVEYIYASEDATSTDNSLTSDPAGRQSSGEREDHKSSCIIIDTESGEQALVRTELMPSVSGVVVVCSGGSDQQVAQRIMDVVTTALNISSKRVCITQLSE